MTLAQIYKEASGNDWTDLPTHLKRSLGNILIRHYRSLPNTKVCYKREEDYKVVNYPNWFAAYYIKSYPAGADTLSNRKLLYLWPKLAKKVKK